MLGRLLRRLTGDPLDRAARRYAETLPRRLAHDYGASDRYTPDQLRLSAARAKLPPEFLAVAYAAYLDRETFTATLPDRAADYDALRALFLKHQDVGVQSGKGGEESDSVV